MNRQIGRLFVVGVLMIAVLAIFTARWTVLQADALKDEPLNRRPLLEQQQIPRGLILARDGSKLAVNRRIGSHQNKRYYRQYPDGNVFSHAIGYAFVSRGSSGFEHSQNDILSGTGGDLRSFLDEIAGGPDQGDDIKTTPVPAAQRVALNALGPRQGAIVAMDPRSGAVQVMASTPNYDPNRIPAQYGQLNKEQNSPLLNRTTQGQYPPGSTFKVVTAVAGIDSGKFSPDSVLNGDSPKEISGFPLSNDGGESFGDVDLTRALTFSINTVWAQVAEQVGKRTMAKYMERFGFYARPPLDYPAGQRYVSGVFTRRGLTPVSSGLVDVGRVAIGQGGLLATPLQMAMVASAVANDGVLVRPHLTDRIVDPDGRVTDRIGTTKYHRVMSHGPPTS